MCAEACAPAVLAEACYASLEVQDRLADRAPDHVPPKGACASCLQEALLATLLERGEGAFHESIQKAWPLDPEAAFGALPTPLRLHADPRFSGKGVTLAVIDSGFHPHPDLVRPRNRVRAWVDASEIPIRVQRFGPEDTP
ncbi:MAG TPA: hypothetical protein VN083_02840, partial [Vicinamibacteria bacterium]|nr:hypothetical protein [Vicinamibacteria bacterium]